MNLVSLKRLLTPVLAVLLLSQGRAVAFDEWLDSIEDRLSVNTFDHAVSTHLSGLMDLEAYSFRQPAPGLIAANHDFLFNPRVTLFLDGQIGPKIYFFVQSRLDRGFDPADDKARIRLDEYAFRLTPWENGRLNLQVGKFATVVGRWTSRHDSWTNPFITAPLPYENLTAIWDDFGANSVATLMEWYDSPKYLRNPVIWGPSYATGLALSGRLGQFDYAAEVKNAPLSSRPYAWDVTAVNFRYPTFSGRLGWKPNEAWNLGVSASTGSYLLPEAADSLPPGKDRGDYRQVTLAQDISYERHHWQRWAEFFENRFEVPLVGNADAFAYFLEAKYKITPQLFGALRWNQEVYNRFPDASGGRTAWSTDSWRIDAAMTYRLSTHTQVKLQYSLLRQERAEHADENLLAAQFTVRF